VRVKVVPEIDEEALRDRILEVINGHAVVKPGETLVIRLKDWSPDQAEYYQEDLDRRGLPFGPLVVIGDELAVAKPEPGSAADLPGMPRFSVVEIEWAADGETRRQKFGPWMIAPDDSHMAAISGFVNGWSRGSGIEPSQVTLTAGDESIAGDATSPYRSA
jgi:hypothetical protein